MAQMPTTERLCGLHPDRYSAHSCVSCAQPVCLQCAHHDPAGHTLCPVCVRRAVPGVQAAATTAKPAHPPRHFPILTTLIVVACIAVFFYDRENGGTFFVGSSERIVGPERVSNLGEYSLYGPSLEFDGEWYRIVTSAFIHLNLFHLGVNMLVLWSIGGRLERRYGSLLFAPLYLAALLGGSLGVLILDPTTQSGGASGAVFGLVGVVAVLQLFAKQYLAAALVAAFIGLDVALSFTPGISLGGHVGGLVVGLIAGMLIGLERRRRRTLIVTPVAIAAVGFVAFAASVAVVLRLGELSPQLGL